MKKINLLGVAASVLAGGFMAFGQQPEEKKASQDTILARNMTIFNAITNHLAQVYVDSLRPDVAFDAAIGAMLYTVDPYTEYYNSNEVERLEVMTTGSYGGIGSFIMEKDGDTFIQMPIDNSPSMKAGLKAGDRIVKVDSTDVRGKGSEFTIKRLKGDPGTNVTITVERPYDADSVRVFNVMREKVQEKSVPFYGVIDGIGYIKLNSFMEKSADEVKKAIESFRNNPEVEGVVLDLRNNGGGLVSTAVDILGMFLPRGTKVLETKGKTEDAHTVYKTTHSPLLPDMPLVVMINDESASASEITAGAIQDLDRGVLVGKKSFGKGLVQSTYGLPYNGVLKVTTAKYHLPSGRLIQALDYSRRKPDGSVAPTPDSLTNEFKTMRGRTVRDGGGLVPDSVISDRDYSRLVYNLVVARQLFDYATKYAATHPSIDSPGTFRIDDATFADFVEFVDTAKIKSDKTGEKLLGELRKTANTEGFMTDELLAALDSMEPLVAPDLRRDLYNKRDEIEEFLGKEIVARYYNEAGEEEYSLRYDNEFAIAKEILKTPDLYRNFLKPHKK